MLHLLFLFLDLEVVLWSKQLYVSSVWFLLHLKSAINTESGFFFFFMFVDILIFSSGGLPGGIHVPKPLSAHSCRALPPARLLPLLKDTPQIAHFYSQQTYVISFKQGASAEHWDKAWRTMNICVIKEYSVHVCEEKENHSLLGSEKCI